MPARNHLVILHNGRPMVVPAKQKKSTHLKALILSPLILKIVDINICI